MVKNTDVEMMSRFRRHDPFVGVPEIQLGQASDADRINAVTPPLSVDLNARPKVWFLLGNGMVGKTTYARWLIWRMLEHGRNASLAAIDPGTRALTTWFDNVEQPPTRDTARTVKWLSDFLDYLMEEQAPAVLDFGAAGDVALKSLADRVSGLHTNLEQAGLGVVACHVMSPRILDLDPLIKMEKAGFQPPVTLLVLNEGKVDSSLDPQDAFAPILRHSAFRKAVDRGAVPLWLPALDAEVAAELELKQLHFGMARDGQVPEGATFSPIGGLRRSSVGRWLERVEDVHRPIRTCLP